jgi:hypothetical protein
VRETEIRSRSSYEQKDEERSNVREHIPPGHHIVSVRHPLGGL